MKICTGGPDGIVHHTWHGWIKAPPWEGRVLRRMNVWMRATYNWRGWYWSIQTSDEGMAKLIMYYETRKPSHWTSYPLSSFTLVESRQVWGDERIKREGKVMQYITEMVMGGPADDWPAIGPDE